MDLELFESTEYMDDTFVEGPCSVLSTFSI